MSGKDLIASFPGQVSSMACEARNRITIMVDMLTCINKFLVDKRDKFVVNYGQPVRWALPPECYK